MIPSSAIRDGIGEAMACGGLDCFSATFAGSNPDTVVHGKHEDFPVANFAIFSTATAFQDRVDRGLDKFFIHADLQLHLAKQADTVIATTHGTGLAALTPEALAIHHGESVHLHASQRFLDGI